MNGRREAREEKRRKREGFRSEANERGGKGKGLKGVNRKGKGNGS